jgi:hypothetical protein
MTLILDHQQRLYLIALMGAQKGSLAEIRQLWGMQDRLELSEEEKRSINLRVILRPDGAEATAWDSDKKLDSAGFDFTEAELRRLRKLIDEWTLFTSADRIWVESLVEQIESLSVSK